MSISLLDDKALIDRYLNGSEAALETLINRYKSKIYTHVIILVKDRETAEDIFQDTFIKVINTLKTGRYNEEGKFLPWVIRIAHNLAIDHFRKVKKMPMSRSDEDYDIFGTVSLSDNSIEHDIVQDQIYSDVRKLIDLLPEEQRQVVIMRHYQGMSFKEIAETTNVSINTALGRMRYAVLNIRKIVEEKNIVLTNS
jgi:RNA polymerase sigma-70 factor (ECF subfamily)